MPTPPIKKLEREGSNGQRLICTYQRPVPPGIKDKLVAWLKRHYKEYIHRVRWITDRVIRVSLKHACIREAGGLCIEQALKTKCEDYVAQI